MQEAEEPLSSGESEVVGTDAGKSPVVIPDEAKLPTPKFHTFEDALTAGKAIAAFIRKEGRVRIEGGVRYLNAHPDETYSKPPSEGRVEYLAEFVLPEEHAKVKRRHSPCNCCSFEFPKFSHGVVAWFPDEAVLRVVGPVCFARLNPEGHETALLNYRARVKREKELAAILRNIPMVGGIRDAIEYNLEIARALDIMRFRLRGALTKHDVRLWPAIRQGWLNVLKQNPRNTVGSYGRMRRSLVPTKVKHAPVRGAMLIAPLTARSFEVRLQECLALLSTIETTQAYYDAIERADDRERSGLALAMQRAFKELKTIEKEMIDRLQFVSLITLRTIHTWSMLDDSEIDLYFELSDDDSVLHIGRGIGSYESIPIEGALRRQVAGMSGNSETDLN